LHIPIILTNLTNIRGPRPFCQHPNAYPITRMKRTISISDAKSHLSELVGRMMYAGDHIIVERHGKAVAVMVPIEDYTEYQQSKREQKQVIAQERSHDVLPGLR